MQVLSVVHEKFGKRIKELRSEHKMTQEDLADLVGVDRSYMGFLERGEKNPTLKNIAKIAEVLKVTLSELFRSV